MFSPVTPQTPTLSYTGCTTVEVGTGAALVCATPSSPPSSPITYKFYKDGQAYEQEPGSNTLNLSPAVADSGAWSCKVEIKGVLSDKSSTDITLTVISKYTKNIH